jgi:hypothetical protein
VVLVVVDQEQEVPDGLLVLVFQVQLTLVVGAAELTQYHPHPIQVLAVVVVLV